MKIVFLWSYYERYLSSFYEKYPSFSDMMFPAQQRLLFDDYFGEIGSYTKWLNAMGHEVTPIIANCEPMQRRWALDNGIPFTDNWRTAVAIEQVKRLRPDIFFMESVFDLYGAFLDEIKNYAGKTMGWISCPIPPQVPLGQMALILSSHPDLVDSFRSMGIGSEYLLPAFDPDIVSKLPQNIAKDVEVSFVGGISPAHKKRHEFLARVARKTPLKIWGYRVEAPGAINGIRRLFRRQTLEKRHMGEVWGIEMYQLLKRSKITLNYHIDAAGDLAGNMRLFEATGVGTLLITDNKSNLADIFIPGKEVVTYDSADEAIDKINYYLIHEKEREEIAAAGQKRTLRDYNYQNHVTKMSNYFLKYNHG